MAFVAEQVAPHERIRAVELIDEIPKSAVRASCCAGCWSSASGRRWRADRAAMPP